MIRSLLCILALCLMFWGAGFLHGRMKPHPYRLTMKLLLAVYILFCLYMTLLSRTPNDFHPITFVPLSTFMRIIGLPVESWRDLMQIINGTKMMGQPHLDGIDGMIQNIALFVPLGLLIRGGWTKMTIKRVVLLGFLCSLSIELVQLVARLGWFDVDDILFNTFGAYQGAKMCDYVLRDRTA